MGFFKRVGDIVTANISDLLDRMEDPEKMMKQLVREIDKAAAQAKEALIKTLAHERLLEKQVAVQEKKIDEWQARAVEAVRQARDDLARKALEFKSECQDIAAALRLESKAAIEASVAARTQLRAIQAKGQEAKRKEAGLSARQRTAKVRQKAAGVSARGKVEASAIADFARMEEKVDQMEAEAMATAEAGGDTKNVEDEFTEWESGRKVDAELAELKKKMGSDSG